MTLMEPPLTCAVTFKKMDKAHKTAFSRLSACISKMQN